jgi:hypothetical protein
LIGFFLLQESDFDRREEHWHEVKRALEDQIHSLKAELKEREEEYIKKCKGKSLGFNLEFICI